MDGGNQLGGDEPAELVLMGGSNERNGDGVKARREEKSGDMNGGVKPGGDEPAELAQMGGSNERNGDGWKARTVSSGLDSYYQWHLPVERLGSSWRGMFMRGSGRYDVKNTPSCQGILPKSAYVNAPIWKSDAGVSELKLLSELQRKVENNESIPQDLEDFMLKERWLIWMPRFGLGNSLRAYTSAFIFALLSGRRLLRWKGGNHKQVRAS
ncbi:unnamed protein product [Closterium sp. NIES-64]|nr:unnamed protein product [Closterium sp. NIES-64]